MTPLELHAEGNQTPNFDEPWQARAFGIVNLLFEQGLIASSDWSNCLGSKREVDAAEDRGYWQDWLATIEDMLSEREILPPCHLDDAIHAIAEAREHRHMPSPEPVAIDPARAGSEE
jgi:Nitrile hydratase beta subunit